MMIDMAIPFPAISPNLFEIPAFVLGGLTIGPLALRWYALSYVVGIILAWRLMLKLAGQPKVWGGTSPINRDDVDDFMFYAILGILLGGRIGYVVLYRPDMFGDPMALLRIWEGGMSFHGGFVGVCLAVIGTAIGRKVSLLALADMVAVAAPFGLFLGRIANFINQELYGRVSDVSWAFIFRTDPAGLPRHPSQLYQAFMEGIVIFVILRFATAKFGLLKKRGMATGLFMMLYGSVRMIGEQFREPDASLLLGITRGTAYSIPMILVGLGFVIYALTRKPAQIAPAAPQA
jgi:phosphatidylglycerol---prolipoprotein diacylglyceryl transferase